MIIAGVLLLLAAVLDLIAGVGYGIFGTGAELAGEVVEEGGRQAAAGDPAAADLQRGTEQAAAEVRAAGAVLTYFGHYLMILGILAVAAGIVLFMKTAPLFALVVGCLQLVPEGVGIYLWNFHVGVTNVFCITVGILVIIAAMQIRAHTAPTTPAVDERSTKRSKRPTNLPPPATCHESCVH